MERRESHAIARVNYAKAGATKDTPKLARLVIMYRHIRRFLGLPECPNQELEKCSFLIYESMEASSRTFHNFEHIMDLSKGADPIQIAAIAFHDVIYYHIDGGLSNRQREYLHDVIVEKDGIVSITKEKLETSVEMVMDIFGYKYGQVLDPYKGMNEFLSACLGCRIYSLLDRNRCEQTLSLSVNAKCAACIEATIPFRGPDDKGRSPPEALFDRLGCVNEKYDFGWEEAKIVGAVQRAADLGNRDLENFSWTDRAAFLSNTWKLLPESNVALRNHSVYLSELALAMKKMAGFFEFLNPETIYFSFRDPKAEAIVTEKTAEAKRNIDTAFVYMRCKYLALSFLSAVAELSGGDAPISFFTGDLQNTHTPMSITLENFLGKCEPAKGLEYNEDVWKILHEGRKLETDFDTKHSPLGAFLYAHIGDVGMKESIKYAVHPMDEENALLLLQSIPAKPRLEILSACSEVALTRRAEIVRIIDELGHDHCAKRKRTN